MQKKYKNNTIYRSLVISTAIVIGVTGVILYAQEDVLDELSTSTSTSTNATQPKQLPGKVELPLLVTAIPTADYSLRHRSVVMTSSSDVIASLANKQAQLTAKKARVKHQPPKTTENDTATPAVSSQAYYTPQLSAPPGRSDLVFATPEPIPIKEIIEKRQRIAQGERLYQRAVLKKPATEKRVVGGLRLVSDK